MRPGLRSASVRSVFARRPVVWAALSYALVATLVLWPSIRPGRTLVPADDLTIVTPYSALPGAHEPHNLQLSDVTFQFFPWFSFMSDGLRHGEIRQWNPTILAGVPVTPNGNVSPYYPPSWLGAVLSPFDAYDLFVLLHLILGALGIYVLSRALGARAGPSWVAGLLAFTAAFWVHWSTHLVHLAGMVWVPWVLAATTWLLAATDRGPRRRRAAALAAVVGLWLLGGSPQYLYFGGLALLGWTATILVARRFCSRGRDGEAREPVLAPGLAFAGAMVLGALLAAPVLLPTLTTAGQVARQRETEAQTAHVPKKDAIRVLVPDATGNAADSVLPGSNDELRMDSPFVGVTGALLAAAAVAGLGRRTRSRWLLAAGAAVILALAFTGLPHRVLYAALPGYDRFRASPRWLFLLPVFSLPLAAFGLQDLLAAGATSGTGAAAGGRSRNTLVCSAAVGAVAVAGWFAYQRSRPGAPTTYFAHRALLAVGLLAVLAAAAWARSRPRVTLAMVAATVLVEVFANTPRWYPQVPQHAAYPDVAVARIAGDRGGRIVRVGARTPFGPFAPDLATEYGIDDVQGLSVLFPKDYDRYLRLIDDYGLYARIANIAPPLRTADRLRSPLLDVLDVRTVVAERDVPIPADYGLLVDGASEPSVYARASPGPAMVVAAASPATEDQMWERLAAPDWDPASSSAVLGLPVAVTGRGGTVTGRAAPADRELWDVDAPAGGFLRVGSRWDAGWTATVDGKRAAVRRADGVFRGVVVPAGRHLVRFSYRNPGEMQGRWAGILGGVALIALLLPWPAHDRAGRRSGPVPEVPGTRR